MNSARSSTMLFSPAVGLRRFGLPRPGIAATGSRSCGGSIAVIALADDDDRLAAFAQRAQLDRQAFERAQRHLAPNPLDGLGRVQRVALLGGVPRLVVELAALEALEHADHRLVIARQRDGVERRQRIHDGEEIVRRRAVLDEVDERLARRHAVAQPHVVVVEEEHEDARILVGGRASLRRRACGSGAAFRPAPRRRPSRSGTSRSSAACRPRATSKSVCFRSTTGLPCLSVTMTSTRTKLMPVRKVGCWGCRGRLVLGRAAWLPGPDAASAATAATPTMAHHPRRGKH